MEERREALDEGVESEATFDDAASVGSHLVGDGRVRQQVIDRVAQVAGIVGLDIPAGGQRAERRGKLRRGEEAWWWRCGSRAPVAHDIHLAARARDDDGLA